MMKKTEPVRIEFVRREVNIVGFICRVFRFFIIKRVVEVYG
jgi:hypothetical protein